MARWHDDGIVRRLHVIQEAAVYSIESKVGRLVELRFEGDVSETEIKAFRSRMLEIVVRLGKPAVFCVDSRDCGPLVGEAGLMIVGLMRSDNRSLERSAVVLRPGSPVSDQLEKAISEAKNAYRRTFHEPVAAIAWLRPILESAEIEELTRFLAPRA